MALDRASCACRQNPPHEQDRLAPFLLFLFSSACLLACGPSIDKAAKADIDQRVAALAHTGQTFPAPTGLRAQTPWWGSGRNTNW
jgi:hypothetical protein